MQLLTTLEMASFVADGYLRFDAVVPPEVNDLALAQIQALQRGQAPAEIRADSGTPFDELFPDGGGLRQMLDVAEVRGAVESLVGLDSVYDHMAVHYNPAGATYRQHLHADAAIDSMDPTFDIQLFYFPHDVGPDSGGTRFVPGTHLRRVHEASVGRYQHLNGEQFFEGPAGTVLIFHGGLWHAGHVNPSEVDRWMFKLRLNPTKSQTRRWEDSDYDEVTPASTDHIFANAEPGATVANELRKLQPWSFSGESRLETMEKVRLWRYLSGDAAFDVDWYRTRIEQRALLVSDGEVG